MRAFNLERHLKPPTPGGDLTTTITAEIPVVLTRESSSPLPGQMRGLIGLLILTLNPDRPP